MIQTPYASLFSSPPSRSQWAAINFSRIMSAPAPDWDPEFDLASLWPLCFDAVSPSPHHTEAPHGRNRWGVCGRHEERVGQAASKRTVTMTPDRTSVTKETQPVSDNSHGNLQPKSTKCSLQGAREKFYKCMNVRSSIKKKKRSIIKEWAHPPFNYQIVWDNSHQLQNKKSRCWNFTNCATWRFHMVFPPKLRVKPGPRWAVSLWRLFNQLRYTHSHVMQPELGWECDFLSVQQALILLLVCNRRVRVNWSFCSPSCCSRWWWNYWFRREMEGLKDGRATDVWRLCVFLGVRFTRMAGLTALRGWSASDRAEIKPQLHHKSAPSHCPMPKHAALRFGL